jgi:membrane protease YdiL (CAAX protease family)
METSVPAPPVEQQSKAYIAPWWHTAILVLFLLGFSAVGSAGHAGLDHSMRMKLYLSTVIMEWIMLLFIVWGIHRRKQTTLRDLVGGRWNSPEDFLIDLAVAFGFWIVAGLVLAAVGYALGLGHMGNVNELEKRIGSMLPQGKSEIAMWLLLCVTAGFCEEVIFRGYFQKQFAIVLNSAWAGIVVQGLIFGGSHAYEGWQKMIQIAVFGCLFGALAYWRKSLRPGMMTHFAQDSVAGLFARFAFEHARKALPR